MLWNSSFPRRPEYDAEIISQSGYDPRRASGAPDQSEVLEPTFQRLRKRCMASVMAWLVVGAGAAGWTVALSCVIVSLPRLLFAVGEAAFPYAQLPVAVIQAFVPVAITRTFLAAVTAWLVVVVVALLLIVPSGMRSMGIRLNKRMPRILRGWCEMNSLADHLRQLRAVLLVGLLLPLFIVIAEKAALFLTGHARPLVDPLASEWLPSLIGSSLFVCAGWVLLGKTTSIYRSAHTRKLRRSLRAHYRGVALRSFIAAYDNPLREIYRTCRLSARIAKVHRVTYVAAVGCFSAAACLAAMMPARFFIGEALCVVAMISIASRWPTCRSVVRWSSKLLDPFCRERDEYIEY